MNLTGGNCVYPSRNAIELNLPTNDYDYDINNNNKDIYGSTNQTYERFRDLGIPIFVLQLPNKNRYSESYPTQYENENESSVISDEMFENLFNMVADTRHKKYTSNDSIKNRKTHEKQKNRKTEKQKK